MNIVAQDIKRIPSDSVQSSGKAFKLEDRVIVRHFQCFAIFFMIFRESPLSLYRDGLKLILAESLTLKQP